MKRSFDVHPDATSSTRDAIYKNTVATSLSAGISFALAVVDASPELLYRWRNMGRMRMTA